MDDRPTATDAASLKDDDNVQITASKDELMRRINVFMQLKKKQVDMSNQQEFTSIQNHFDDTQEVCTCARVDSNKVTKGHITVHRVKNIEGPNANLPKPEEVIWSKLVLLGHAEQNCKPKIT